MNGNSIAPKDTVSLIVLPLPLITTGTPMSVALQNHLRAMGEVPKKIFWCKTEVYVILNMYVKYLLNLIYRF